MRIFASREPDSPDPRVPLTPQSAAKLVKLGLTVSLPAGLGAALGWPDRAYADAGASVSQDPAADLAQADMVFALNPPSIAGLSQLKKGAALAAFLDPFHQGPLLHGLARAGLRAISVEMMPRTTLAQKMDALSSQANLAGYAAVLLAADRCGKVFPMMMTPAGTIPPARVLVIGVGVAGLQAIATAKRLGAIVEAFDTRPVVEEQVKSLGARFVKVDLGETGQTAQGYAKALTDEQLERQREALTKVAANADVVITTAQVFGQRAPRILTGAMVAQMKPGTVVVDLAVETGGNVEGAELDRENVVNGVRIFGLGRMAGRVPRDASEMFAANLANFVEHFWDKKGSAFNWNFDDPILQACVVTRDGAIAHAGLAERHGPVPTS